MANSNLHEQIVSNEARVTRPDYRPLPPPPPPLFLPIQKSTAPPANEEKVTVTEAIARVAVTAFVGLGWGISKMIQAFTESKERPRIQATPEELEQRLVSELSDREFATTIISGYQRRAGELLKGEFTIDIVEVRKTNQGFFVKLRVDGSNVWDIYKNDKPKFEAYALSAIQKAFGKDFRVSNTRIEPGSLLFGVDIVIIGAVVGIIGCITALVSLAFQMTTFFRDRSRAKLRPGT